MTLDQVLPALRAGKKIRRKVWADLGGLGANSTSVLTMNQLTADDWEVVEEPLTDEQLIAEWERRAEEMKSRGVYWEMRTWETCARQLRERKL